MGVALRRTTKTDSSSSKRSAAYIPNAVAQYVADVPYALAP